MDRKDFLLSACALCGFGVAATMLDSCTKTAPVDFTINLNDPANAALGSVGGYAIANGGTAIVRRTASGYSANSLICTHEGCTVSYQGASGFVCPCHGGTFDTNGRVTGGPPPSALAVYTVTQSGSILTIRGIDVPTLSDRDSVSLTFICG
jgi:Rieske Fe-S protein